MRLTLIACALVILAGCAAPAERPTTASDDIDRALADAQAAARAPAEPPAAVVDALLPAPSGLGPEAMPEVEPRFDLNVNAQPARAFFHLSHSDMLPTPAISLSPPAERGSG